MESSNVFKEINRFLFLHEFLFIKLLFAKMSYLFSLITEFLIFIYLGILFFANPEMVANANIPKRATPRNNPAP